MSETVESGNQMPETESERRILRAVEKVEQKVDTLVETTGTFTLQVTDRLARIDQIELACPINEVEVRLRGVEQKVDAVKGETKRTSALVASIIGGVWTAILAFFGLHDKMGG